MPTTIDRDQVERLLAEGAQLVDVLPSEEHADAHLPGAISLPLWDLDRRTAGRLERTRPVIVYCHDAQ
jgi:rhodanese-related sulfurtransferase